MLFVKLNSMSFQKVFVIPIIAKSVNFPKYLKQDDNPSSKTLYAY